MLRPKKKITRKELKKDPMLEKISQLDTYIRAHRKLLAYIALGIVAVCVILILMFISKKKANTEAMGELGLAEMALARNDLEDATLRLEAIVDKYQRTKSAGIASVLLGQVYLNKGDYANARINYEKYVDDYEDEDLLTATAYNGLGVCAEVNEEYLKAARYFEKGGAETEYKFQRHEAFLNAARNYLKANSVEKARKLVELILKAEPEARHKNAAEVLAAQITVLSN